MLSTGFFSFWLRWCDGVSFLHLTSYFLSSQFLIILLSDTWSIGWLTRRWANTALLFFFYFLCVARVYRAGSLRVERCHVEETCSVSLLLLICTDGSLGFCSL